jgi:hypothetical protein
LEFEDLFRLPIPRNGNAFKQAEKMVAVFEKKRDVLSEDISSEIFTDRQGA